MPWSRMSPWGYVIDSWKCNVQMEIRVSRCTKNTLLHYQGKDAKRYIAGAYVVWNNIGSDKILYKI